MKLKKQITNIKFILILLLFTSLFSYKIALAVPYIIEEFTGANLAFGVNNSDVIVGNGSMANRDGAYSYDFRNGIFTDLSPLGTFTSWAHAVNDQGVIVGGGVSDRYRAFYWQNGNVIDLTPPDSYGANALDVNRQGQAVGYSKDMVTEKMQAILWEGSNGSYTYLNSGQYANTFARAINNNGQIVGTGESSRKNGLFWENSNSSPIEIPAPTNVYREITPLAINNFGSAVGYARGYYFWGHAFLYSNNQFTDLHDSTLWEHTFASDINERGQVLIEAIGYDGSDHILILENGIFEDITPVNYRIFLLSEINDLGHIVGSGGTLGTGNSYAFLATPVPEPSTMLLLGSGLIGLVGYGRKKFFKK